MTTSVLAAIRKVLTANAQAARAEPMRAYMRNQFPFLGVPTPLRRQSLKPIFAELKGSGAAQLIAIAKQLWALPEREYQYAALDMLALRHTELGVGDLSALLLLAQQKSWWDTVDGLASIIGDILAGRHDGMDAALSSPNMWLRRIAMLHQLGWRARTDSVRLFNYARTLAPEGEFFIQKAIGWALRDYARHDPDAVAAFLRAEKDHLAPLSYREANKHLKHLKHD
ncbi:MAG TPA: DNA alkylation repair protein [Burkholderiaceae bacterium]|nr:DNA alkylation repair protein [Burkholderiaceae bacterium]